MKKKFKNKNLFPKDHEVLWDILLPRNIPKKITKSYFFRTFLIFYLLYICIIF